MDEYIYGGIYKGGYIWGGMRGGTSAASLLSFSARNWSLRADRDTGGAGVGAGVVVVGAVVVGVVAVFAVAVVGRG